MGEEIERSWRHPGLRADIDFVASLVNPDRAEALAKWLDSWRTTAEDRARTAFEAAAEAADLSAEQLLESIMADEKLTDLFRMAMELAARTGDERKLQALGRALASGAVASDDAEYDEAPLLMRTIGQLESADVRVLLRAPKGPFVRLRESPEAVWVHLEQLGLIEKVPSGNYPSTGKVPTDVMQNYQVSRYGNQILSALLSSADEEASEDDEGLQRVAR